MIQDMELRPLSTGELLDRSLRLYRRNFWNFLGISAIIQVPVAILSLLILSTVFQDLVAIFDDPLGVTAAGAGNSTTLNLLSNVNTLVSSVLVQFANAALALAVAGALFGRKLSFSHAYKAVFKRWQSLLGTAFLTAVVVVLLLILTLMLLLTFVGWIGSLGALLFFSIAVSSLLVPVVMLERASAWDVIPRAWNLARRHFWRIIWFVLILALLVGMMQIGPGILIGGVLAALFIDGSMSSATGSDIVPGLIAGAVGSTILSIFIIPLRITAMTLFYFDIRVRDEGLDLLVATKIEGSDPFDALADAPRNQNEKIWRWGDVPRYFGLGFSIFALYALIVGILVGLILAFASAVTGF